MGFLPTILAFFGLAAVPYFAPGIVLMLVPILGLGFMGEIVASYGVPFFMYVGIWRSYSDLASRFIW